MARIIGVDESKARLDLFRLEDERRLAVGNDLEGIARLAAWVGEGALVVMEASGGYERSAHHLLTGHGVSVAVVNPERVRKFARAGGLLAKTDRLDAVAIARYGALLGRRRPRSAAPPGRSWPSCSPTGSG